MSGDEAAAQEASRRIRRLLDSRAYEDAVAACSEAVERYPDQGRFYYSRAQAKLLSGGRNPDFTAAIEDVSRAIELSPEEPTGRFFRGIWSLELGDWSRAAEDLAEAVALEEVVGSNYYVDSARLLRALALRELGDANRAKAEVAKCHPSASFYARRRLWKVGDI